MSVTDPIADMFTCMRNANMKFHEKVDVPASNIKESILKILQEQGFISNYKKIEDNKKAILRIYMKYPKRGVRVINELIRISKPGLRNYKSYEDMPRVRGGLGMAIVSTSQGIMTNFHARKKHIGGEIICYIW
jgi:small subunit ribosomal protein S8